MEEYNTFGLIKDIKEFIVDFNSPSEMKRLITRLQHRRKTVLRLIGADYVQFNGSKYNVNKILPVLESMLDTDISSLYINRDERKNYYVYAHCDPTISLHANIDIKHILLASKFGLTHEPFYIGKGIGDRCFQLDRNDSHRKIRSHLKRKNEEILVHKVSTCLSESEALSLESKLIDILGLRSLSKVGMLINLDEGEEPINRRRLYPTNSGYTQRVLQRNGFA